MDEGGGNAPLNPLDPAAELEQPSNIDCVESIVHPQKDQMIEDSAVTKAEKYERHGTADEVKESPAKRRKLDATTHVEEDLPTSSERRKAVASIKPESAFSIASDRFAADVDQVSCVSAWE